MFGLHVETSHASGRIVSVKILNKDESGEKIQHEISIGEKDSGPMARTIEELIQALIGEKHFDDRFVPTPGDISIDVGNRSISSEIKVRRSRYAGQHMFFIIKGTEKEEPIPPIPYDTPPSNIEIEGEGDFVSVSRENIPPLVEVLTKLSNLLS